MSVTRKPNTPKRPGSTAANNVRVERAFKRFTLSQRWEHGLLMLSFTVLLLTGLPQKYFSSWGYRVLPNPESLFLIRRIHHIFAILLTIEVLYHLGRGVYLLFKRRLSDEIFPTWQDVRDAWQMTKYLLFLSKEKPSYGKYNFEQKFTYWFLFLAIGIMVITGFILWFPIQITYLLPGGIVPAALLAHSSEAVAAGLFIVIWHFFHVHIERLNLSIFTGRLNERDMREYHASELERLSGKPTQPEAAPGRRKGGGK